MMGNKCKTTTTSSSINDKVKVLTEKINVAESMVNSNLVLAHSSPIPTCPNPEYLTASVIRAYESIKKLQLYSSLFRWVPTHYYALKLEQRKALLLGDGVNQLCKAMLMENNRYSGIHEKGDSFYPRFILVVVQYIASINPKKLNNYLRGEYGLEGVSQPPSSSYNYRVASETDNMRLTGFEHNAVSPFGLIDETIPIILPKSITDSRVRFIWLGGGHEHLKVGVAVSELLGKCGVVRVGDVSDVRAPLDGGDDF